MTLQPWEFVSSQLLGCSTGAEPVAAWQARSTDSRRCEQVVDRASSPPAGAHWHARLSPTIVVELAFFEGVEDAQVAHHRRAAEEQGVGRKSRESAPAPGRVGRGGVLQGRVAALDGRAPPVGPPVGGWGLRVCLWAVLALTSGVTVMVDWVQHGGRSSGAVTSGRFEGKGERRRLGRTADLAESGGAHGPVVAVGVGRGDGAQAAAGELSCAAVVSGDLPGARLAAERLRQPAPLREPGASPASASAASRSSDAWSLSAVVDRARATRFSSVSWVQS